MPKAKKSLGQNFLIDTSVVNQIIQFVNPDSSHRFLEIGPGKGVITQRLVKSVNEIHAVEIDKDLLRDLTQIKHLDNFYLHNQSILDFDPNKISHGGLRVIGNLPYNISTPIMLWSFKYLEFFSDMHFMFQKEFGDRLVSENNKKTFGRISVITQYLTQPKYCFMIEPESFFPKPKVDSVFIRFDPIKGRSLNDPIAIKLQEVTKITFMHKRKMIGKSLQKILSENQLAQLDIDSKSRPENLSVEDYVKIAKVLI
ncbi:16S rRNA (adenine(1518)-N(6)/adenine(1519)-N(6))-dimethyltransferase RsmA [Gammaproteobacteria bacterium]|nr:16S rRNA (adenine(1518)-N(6)/adenine(1519)-N(6))-dimethyltransferase RsmA [Gammaproteobacteria bacterium]